ncbi:MAG TPA: hypothetical protein GX706_02160 [Candidatus Moranbacteria bacterium]|nr:hypothetical protein [Candidatus Moranbacteria bacterium]
MKKFDDLLAKANILDEDKILFQKVLSKQDSVLIEKVKIEVENDPEILSVLVDLVKLKIIGDKDLNKRYLTSLLGKKISAVIS